MKNVKSSIRTLQLSLCKQHYDLQEQSKRLMREINIREKGVAFNPNGIEIDNRWFNIVDDKIALFLEFKKQMRTINQNRRHLSAIAKQTNCLGDQL